MGKRQVLGKGLQALIAEYPETADGDQHPQIVQLHVDEIEPNPYQPRNHFDEDRLRELADSIREQGIIQPIAVNRTGNAYHIIAGERRWRAAKMTGAETVPAIVHDIDSTEDLMELSLVENIQREDLNPVEEAEGYRALIDTCLLTQEQVARKVGRDRSTVANTLRLLKLPSEVLEFLRRDQLQMGHARALIPLERDDCVELGRRCVEEEMTVRELERAVQAKAAGKGRRKRPDGDEKPKRRDPIIESYEEKLRHRYATAVGIRRQAKKGHVEIEFYDDDDLERILDLLLGNAD